MKDYDLPIESVDYAKNKLTELENRYQAGEISNDVYDFLKAGQRVEINAFTPVELKEYLETKFKEVGIEKLKPESKDDIDTFEAPSFEDIRKDAVDEAIGRWIRSQCEDKLFDFLTDNIDFDDLGKDVEEDALLSGFNENGNEIDNEGENKSHKSLEKKLKEVTDDQAKTIYDTITKELESFPPKSWHDLNDEEKDKIGEQFYDLECEYKSEIKRMSQKLLDDKVNVDIEIQDNGDMTESTREIEASNDMRKSVKQKQTNIIRLGGTLERLSNSKAVRFEIDENQLHPQHNSKWGIGGIFSAYFDRATAINNFGTDKVQRALDGEKIKCSLVCELG